MLTEPIVAGASYVDGDGLVFSDFSSLHHRNVWVGFRAGFGWVAFQGDGRWVTYSGQPLMEDDNRHLVRRHLPVPQGVYHVSDGDTQLKRELDAWIANGGEWEFFFKQKWDTGVDFPCWENQCLYRAVGCTQDREFPQPAPPALQMRAGHCKTRNGRIGTAVRNPGDNEYPWEIVDDRGRSWMVTNCGYYMSGHKSEWDIVELLGDPPAPLATLQPDPMQRLMTVADFIDYIEFVHSEDSPTDAERIAWWRNRAREAGRA